MTATLTARPTPSAPVRCSRCGRPLTSPVSRVLRIGSHCRAGATEHELVAAIAGAAA